MWVIKIKTSNDHYCFYVEGLDGDPGRTLKIECASVYESLLRAKVIMEELTFKYPKRKFWPHLVQDRKNTCDRTLKGDDMMTEADSENFYCLAWQREGYMCDEGQCDRCKKSDFDTDK